MKVQEMTPPQLVDHLTRLGMNLSAPDGELQVDQPHDRPMVPPEREALKRHREAVIAHLQGLSTPAPRRVTRIGAPAQTPPPTPAPSQTQPPAITDGPDPVLDGLSPEERHARRAEMSEQLLVAAVENELAHLAELDSGVARASSDGKELVGEAHRRAREAAGAAAEARREAGTVPDQRPWHHKIFAS